MHNEPCHGQFDKGTTGTVPRGRDVPAASKAVAFKKGKVKYLYFVAETKDSLSGMELRKVEQAKISYAEKHFKALSGADFKYHVVTNYDDLLARS